MSIDQVTATLLYFFQINVLLKLFMLVLLFFYFIFTLVAYRESSLMSQTLNSSVSPFIRLIAILQILFILFLFFLGVMIL